MSLVTSLSTRTFRNLADQDWRPSHGANLLYGANGAGKSSLLEAAYLTASTRSFRTSRLAECCRLGESAFFLAADVEGDERVRLEISWDAQGKRRALNGKPGSIVEHLGVIPLVSWTTRDNDIFQGPPAVRRRMLDRGIVSTHPASIAVVTEYRQALEAKRSALDSQGALLEEWNRLLARSGSDLVQRRSRWIHLLEAALAKVLERSDFGLGPVTLRYRPSPPEALDGAESFFEAVGRLTRAEMARRQVLAGPHRDDLEILWRNGPVGRMASAGERKLMGLALMIAQGELLAERGSAPLVLIDDLDAELDESRVHQVWNLLVGSSQLVAATSRKSVVSELSAQARWRLRAGRVVDA